MTNSAKYHGKKWFCQYCLQCFSNLKLLDNPLKTCLALNHTKTFDLHKNQKVGFQNYKRFLRAPLIIYADFGRVLKPTTENESNDPETKTFLFLQLGLQINMCWWTI